MLTPPINPSPSKLSSNHMNSYIKTKKGYRKSCVYFIGMPQASAIKIGISSDPEERLSDLQVASPCELVFYAKWWPGSGNSMDWEAKLHWMFRHLHIRGEWFHESHEIKRFIDMVINNDIVCIDDAFQRNPLEGPRQKDLF